MLAVHPAAALSPACGPFKALGVTHELLSWSQEGPLRKDSTAALRAPGVHTLILDWSPVNFVDTVGAKAITSVRSGLTVPSRQAQVYRKLANCSLETGPAIQEVNQLFPQDRPSYTGS